MTNKPVSSEGDEETVARNDAASRPSYERFSPGNLLDDRYRIVALLGAGGMGEVYRADDLKLGQQVALKFLPREMLHPSAIERLYGEVRLGRKISHPNVCRLYDISEWNGYHFVTMEYIDGEDLASLLRRIGKLPQEKAVELSQHICAGLAAAHGLGVVHRDLKPANIMIDGRGNAIITDFGLAALAEDLEGRSDVAGTPAYMAPEQLRRGTATHKSDLYSLGLILYEMFTGHRKFQGRSIEEMQRLHEESDASSIPRETRTIDPVIQQVVLKCLEPDPEDRPRSIHSVIAALPGADPLQAAIDAGDTPSPEMVAAAGESGELSLVWAAGLTVAALVILIWVVWVKQRSELYGLVSLPKHPRVLEEEARKILERTGFDSRARDSSYYLGLNPDYVSAPGQVRNRIGLASDSVPPVVFYYRDSPEGLLSWRGNVGDRRILPNDPPVTSPGMTRVTLSPEGSLVNLLIIPGANEMTRGSEPSWPSLFELAGFDFASARVVEPVFPAPVDTDHRRSWIVPFPGDPESTMRIDAGALGDQIVWFDVVPPWRQANPVDRQSYRDIQWTPQTEAITAVTIAVVFTAFWFARRNLRRGRGDRRGAVRLGLGTFLLLSIAYLLRADLGGYLTDFWNVMQDRVGRALFETLVIIILYLAIEPYLRRRWPTLLVAWSRLLAGRWSDPLVGRHVLLGVVAGGIWAAIPRIAYVVGLDPGVRLGAAQSTLTSVRQALAVSIEAIQGPLLNSIGLTAVMVAIAVLLRRRIGGAVGVWILLSSLSAVGVFAGPDFEIARLILLLVINLIFVAVLYRLGLLAAIVCWLVVDLMWFPHTFDTDAFFFPSSAVMSMFVLGLLAWGLYASIGRVAPAVPSLESSDSL